MNLQNPTNLSGALLIKQQQLDWARDAQIDQSSGYCIDPAENLPWLTSAIRKEIEGGDGNEFKPTRADRKTKIAALHSSSALAVNVFGYWHDNSERRVAAALGFDCDVSGICFERKYPTGVGTRSPNMDVTLTLADGGLLAIESKFSETYTSGGRKVIQEKYFPPGRKLWAENGLPGAQQLAERYRNGESFEYLDATQLLKHLLGLGKQLGNSSWHLMLLWYDVGNEQARVMHEEIKRFSDLLGEDGRRFCALTYQQFWKSLASNLGIDHDAYRTYIDSRYF